MTIHDLTALFTGTLEEIEAVEALIDTMQPYTNGDLFSAGDFVRCPNCGERAHYEEFQTGETIMGNAIHSWDYQCRCGWHSHSFEIE